jgi:iron(III) transport system permease protein
MALSASPPPGLGFLPAPAGEFWCIFIFATAFAPLAALIIGLGHSLMPWPVLESICLSQPPFAAFRIVIFPLLKPFIAASTLIIAMLIMLDGTVPLSLQVPVFATEITSRFLAGSSASSVLLGVWPLLFLMLPMGLAAFKLIKRYSLNDSSAGKTHRCLLPFSSLPAPIKLVLCAGNACFIFLIGLPVTGLIRQAFSRANEGLSLHTDGNAVLWSCGIALLTAIISAVFAVPLGAKLARSRKVFFAILAFLPLFIPASLTGITWATLSTKLHAFFAQMPDGFTIVMAHLARALPYTLLISIFAWKTFSQKSTRESVFFFRTHIRQRLAIELPIFLLCFLVAAVISLRELETSLLTVPPGGQTLPLRVFNLMHYGAGADVCKLSLLLSGLLALASVIIVKRWPK